MVEIPALDFVATNTRPGEPAGADLRKKLARHVTVAAFFSLSRLTPRNRTVAVSSEHSPFVLAVSPRNSTILVFRLRSLGRHLSAR